MSKDDGMGRIDSYDLSKACFTLDKPLEAYVSQQSTASSCQRSALPTATQSCSSTSNETCESSCIREGDNHEESCQRSALPTATQSCPSTSNETCKSSWIREKDNREESCQRSATSTARPSCSSTSHEISEMFWIKEEDNREEIASSFSGLGLYSPQLVHPTKARAKAPRSHRPRKNRSNNASTQHKTEKTIGLEATRPSFRGKEPLGDNHRTSPRTQHTIRDPSKESTSAPSTKDNVRNLRARFEQI